MKLITFVFILSTSLSLFGQHFTLIQTGDFAKDSTNTNGASFIDYDNDGDLDIFLSNANVPMGFNSLYRNEGKDQFKKVEAGELTGLQTVTFGHSWGDYDNDGLEDLFIVNAFTRMGSLLYKNLGNGQFQRNENYNAGRSTPLGFAAAWSDFNLDGFLDLTIVHPSGGFVGLPTTSNFLFQNNGDPNGTFSEVLTTPVTRTTAPFTNPTWTDYDLDGDPDLFIGTGPADGRKLPDYHYKNLLKETGKLQFQRITNTAFAKDSLDGQTWNWIDYDNDGDLDAYLTNWGGPLGGIANHFYENRGDTIIKVDKGDLSQDIGISLANVWADFDNDGDLDVYVGNGGNQPNRYYQNEGNGTFTTITKGHFVENKQKTWAVSVGDYNNDGRLDLLVANKTGYIQGKAPNFLYRNDTDNGYNWLLIKCIGTTSNRSGIGTKVRITANIDQKKVIQYREIGANATFLGTNDRRVHFGLKNATIIDQLELEWPSGQKQTLTNIKVNQVLEIKEKQSRK